MVKIHDKTLDQLHDFIIPIKSEHLARFPSYFANVLSMCGMSQALLAKRAADELRGVVEQGLLTPEEAAEITTAQGVISMIKRGERKAPFNLLILWIRVLVEWHESERLKRICDEVGIPVPVFSKRHIEVLLALAGYAMTAREVREAAEFADTYNQECATIISPLTGQIVQRKEQHTDALNLSAYAQFVARQKQHG